MSTTVAIDRLRCRYRVRAGHLAPWEVRARLDRVAQEQVPAQCRALLAGALPEDENGVLIIRRLDLRLILRAGLPDDARIGALWSRALTMAIARVVAADGGDRLARFESWGAYMAHFVADAAQGTAWERWYYRPFGPLRALSTSAAIRDALRIRPQHIIPALLALDAR